MLGLSPDKLACERPTLLSPLKLKDNPAWVESDAEPDLPYTRDFEKPLGRLTIVLSDSHGNSAHVACEVRHPGDSSAMTWSANPTFPGQLTVNVSMVTSLECEIDREMLQNLWQLVAYYYEYPAVLERGQERGNASGLTYQYDQSKDENSPYFTDLKGYLGAEPSWLLQPKVTLKLNRQQTTSKKLVMEFATAITKNVHNRMGQEDGNDFVWALIPKRQTGQIQTALEGSKTILECNVISSDPAVKLEWILPDLSIIEDGNDKMIISERGQFIILNVSLSDSGLYHCMVRSKTGVDLVPIRLTVKERSLNPTAFNGEKIIVDNGQSFSLPCDVKSVRPSLTVWYLPKSQVLLPTQKTRRVEVMENGTLVVQRSMSDDAGEYSCVASNLYGVDMLSHMVVVTGVKASNRSHVQTYREQQNQPISVQEEGSGADNQEIIQLFATQVPKKTGTQKRKPYILPKRKHTNGSKRKPNVSIKELDPKRWEEIITKVKSKPSVPPTVWSITEPNTESTSATSTTFVTTNRSYLTAAPVDLSTEPTNLPNRTESQTKLYIAKEKSAKGHYNVTDSPPQFSQTQPPSTTEQARHSESRSNKTPVTKDLFKTPQPDKKPHDERRRNYNLVPGQTNRRRPPYRRRRPPMRRLHPHVPFLHSKSNNTQSTILPLPTMKTSPTSTTTTETTFATPLLATVKNDLQSAKHQTGEKEEFHPESEEHLNSERSQNTNELDKSLITFQKANGKESDTHIYPTPQTKVNDMLDPIKSTVIYGNTVSPKTTERSRTMNEIQIANEVTEATHESEKNQEVVTKIQVTHKEKIEIKSTEKSKVKLATQNNVKGDKTKQTTQNQSGPNPKSSVEQNTQTQARTSFSKMATTEKSGGESHIQDREKIKQKAVPETQISPVMEPVHPWLRHSKEGEGQPIPTGRPPSNTDKSLAKVQHKVNSGAPPLSRWPSKHHHHNFYPLYPTWPGQSSAPPLRLGK